jgi:hypothetical protein
MFMYIISVRYSASFMSHGRRSSVGGRSGLPEHARGLSGRYSLEESDFPDDGSYATAGQGEWESVVRSVRSVPPKTEFIGGGGDAAESVGGTASVHSRRRRRQFVPPKPRRTPNFKLLICSLTIQEARITLSRRRQISAREALAAVRPPTTPPNHMSDLKRLVLHLL